jgi:hypothetical protein
MPRKGNGILFEVHPAPLKDKAGNHFVYVRPLGVQKLSMKELDDYCAKNYAMHPGEMTRALSVFMEATKSWLGSGARIETPLGSFAPKIGLRSEKTTADKVGSLDVELQGIEFIPSKEFVGKVADKTYGFRPVNNPDTQKLAADIPHLERALKNTIAACGGYANVRTFMRFSSLTYHSARKQLDAWCQEPNPRLMRTKMGGTFIYTEI